MNNEMDLFSNVNHTDDNEDLPAINVNTSSDDLLDYMVIVITRRLQVTKAFKGGYLLNQLLHEHSRATHDVDFSIDDVQNYESVKEVLIDIGESFKKLGIITSFVVKENISPTSSGGIDFYESDGRKILGVDVGLHPLVQGITSYDFKIATFNGFTVERMLSDKTIAILSRKRFRRTKDIYDFWVITNYFDVDLDTLSKMIIERGNAEWDNIPFNEDVIREYKRAWDKLQLVEYRTGAALFKPDFNEVIDRFYAVVTPVKAGKTGVFWNHKEGCVFKKNV